MNIYQKVYESSLNFLHENTTHEIYRKAIKEVTALTDAEYGSIFLYKNRDLYRVYGSHPKLHKLTPRKSGTSIKTVKQQGDAIMNTDNPRANPELHRAGIKSFLMVTLKDENRSLGIVTALSTKRKFEKQDLEILRQLEPMITLAIKKALHFEENQKELQRREIILSSAAHEIKSPLTVINIYTQALERTVRSGKFPSLSMIEKMVLEERRLTKLVNDLFQISHHKKSGGMEFDFDICDLRHIISRAIVNFGFSYPTHEVSFTDHLGEKKARILADNDKLIQVVLNILNNAGKYSPPGSQIDVNLLADTRHFLIGVKDQGIGIATKDLNRIFNPFYRGKNIAKTSSGLGIGLFLAKSIIDKHKGKIMINSIKNKGTEVSILLPKKFSKVVH